jgi:response regulator RpfG family c-di-GMP phosphodiesterase
LSAVYSHILETVVETSKITEKTWDGAPLKVLFVEDDQINIIFGTALCKKLEFDVMVVKNGQECLAALEEGGFDLVLMDIQMPIMSGEEAILDAVAKSPYHPSTSSGRTDFYHVTY